MKFAVIDIGSNAIRLQIVRVFDENNLVSFKKLEFMRFPLRLGFDVFEGGDIKPETTEKLIKLMKAFRLLIDLFEVQAYKAVATSAMREAKNGQKVQQIIKDTCNINIEIISGSEEAAILNKAIIPFLDDGYFIHIDVGGGSTELNLFEGSNLRQAKSFNIGSVRNLSDTKRNIVFKSMQEWIASSKLDQTKSVMGIGTGGNINKLFRLAKRADKIAISLAELKALKAYVQEFNYEQRLSILKMNPDRADVIVPASEIYINVLEAIGSDHIMVPRVGLKDGLVYKLFEQETGRSLTDVEFIGDF